MKRILLENENTVPSTPQSNTEELWSEEDTYRVQRPSPGEDSGGAGGIQSGPPSHWPDPIKQPPPPPSPPQPGTSEINDDYDIITDSSELTDEEMRKLEEAILGEKGKRFDKHIEINTSPESSQEPLTNEQKEQLKGIVEGIKTKAREDEKRANKGMGLSDVWGRIDIAITIHKTETDWRNILKNFFRPYLSKKERQTYTQPNRRQLQTSQGIPDVIFQGREEINPNITKLQIFVTVDTSGSVDDEMFASFMSEINAIFTTAICRDANVEVRVVLWTGNITGDYLLHDKNFKQYFANTRRSFAGDTRFDKISPYIEQKRYKPIAIVHFTDGFIDVDKSMLYKKNGCKNIIVIPRGLTSSISMAKKVPFDLVIPMTVYRVSGNKKN